MKSTNSLRKRNKQGNSLIKKEVIAAFLLVLLISATAYFLTKVPIWGPQTLPPNFIKHGLLTGVLLLAVFFGAMFLIIQGTIIANDWSTNLRNGPVNNLDKSNITATSESSLESLNGTDAEKERIKEQLQEIRIRANSHISVMIYFYVRYYMSIAVASTSGIIAGICLFFISKVGWDHANEYVINVFLVTSSMAILFGGFPVVFKQEQNVAENKALYLKYIALEDEVNSYFATQENLEGEQQNLKKFIHYLDKQLARINQVAIGFDYTQIPKYQELYKDKL